MAHCSAKDHAQVPATYITFTLAYCHQCSAFTLLESMSTQWADEVLQPRHWSATHYGPFDAPLDVVLDAQDHLEELVMSAGRPWDHQLPEADDRPVIAVMRFHQPPQGTE